LSVDAVQVRLICVVLLAVAVSAVGADGAVVSVGAGAATEKAAEAEAALPERSAHWM